MFLMTEILIEGIKERGFQCELSRGDYFNGDAYDRIEIKRNPGIAKSAVIGLNDNWAWTFEDIGSRDFYDLSDPNFNPVLIIEKAIKYACIMI